METELPNRKPTRLKSFDYSSAGAYFITICTQNKQKILSHIVGGDVLDKTAFGGIAICINLQKIL